jgi:competence protein ComEC
MIDGNGLGRTLANLRGAHVGVAACAVGLAAANALRLDRPLSVVLAVIAVTALVLVLPLPGRLAVVAAVSCLVGCAWGTVRLDSLDHSPLRAYVGRGGRAVVEVTGEARAGSFVLRVPARIRSLDGRRLAEPVELELPLGRAPPQGAVLSALVVVRLPRGPAHGFDERLWLRRQGIHVVLHVDDWRIVARRGGLGGVADRLRGWLRRDATPGLRGQRRAVIAGVVLGDDAALSTGLQTSFRRSGLYHLLAVSGQNVVLLAAGVLGVAWLLGAPRAAGHVAALGAIGAYVLAVGPQPSVIRAAVSGCAVSVAWLLGRERQSWHVLGLAAVVLLGWNPYLLFDAGFQLSFAAVIAIFLFAHPLAELLEGYPVHPKLGAAVAISVACSVVTAPILLVQFGRVPLLGVVANALVEPAVGPLLGLALLTAVVHPVSPGIAYGLAWLNGWLADYVAVCARAVAAVPFAQMSGAAAALAVAVILGAATYAWRSWRTISSRST